MTGALTQEKYSFYVTYLGLRLWLIINYDEIYWLECVRTKNIIKPRASRNSNEKELFNAKDIASALHNENTTFLM